MAKFNDNVAVKIEQKAIVVDSSFSGTHYAIDREGKGMWLLSNGVEVPIAADSFDDFINELKEVWNMFKGRRGLR